MDVNDIVVYCDSHWVCPRCGIACGNDCKGHCLKCLEHIHKTDTHDRTYNCANIAFCYTCKYIYKYSSEIFHILEKLGNILKRAKKIRAASIGCGPASELFGLYQYRDSYKMSYCIEYDGFEKNHIWEPIHNEILKQGGIDKIKFHYCDIFDYYDGTTPLPNLLILNYVISDIVRQSSLEEIATFIDSLVNLISRMHQGSFVVLNDINLGRNNTEARYYYSIIINKLARIGVQTKSFKLHFPSSRQYYYSYGHEVNNNGVVQTIPENIEKKYDPWDECRSAALIFRKEN